MYFIGYWFSFCLSYIANEGIGLSLYNKPFILLFLVCYSGTDVYSTTLTLFLTQIFILSFYYTHKCN